MLPVPNEAPATSLALDPSPQSPSCQIGGEGSESLDQPSPASYSDITRSSECPQAPDSHPELESPFQMVSQDPQTSDRTLQQSDSTVETHQSLEKSSRRVSLQSPIVWDPPQGPEIRLEVQELLGETGSRKTLQGELVPEAQVLKQESPECRPTSAEVILMEPLKDQKTLDQGLELSKQQAETGGHEQRPKGLASKVIPQKPQHTSEEALDAWSMEEPILEGTLASVIPEEQALRDEVAQLRREVVSLEAKLQAQAQRLEARSAEAVCLSEELAQARRTEAEAHQEAEARAREQARLLEAVDRASLELEAASREREALAEALAAAGRERRQWEREGPRLRAQVEAAEQQVQALESQVRCHLEEAEKEHLEKQALREVCGYSRGPGNEDLGQLLGCKGLNSFTVLRWDRREKIQPTPAGHLIANQSLMGLATEGTHTANSVVYPALLSGSLCPFAPAPSSRINQILCLAALIVCWQTRIIVELPDSYLAKACCK